MKRNLTISLYLAFAAVAAAQVKVYTYPSGKDSIEVMHDYRVSICAVADAAIFSKVSDGMMLVVRQDYCRTDALKEAVNQLKFANANILGFVYNCASTGNKRYSRYGKYGKYSKYGKYGSKYYTKYYGHDYVNPASYEKSEDKK